MDDVVKLVEAWEAAVAEQGRQSTSNKEGGNAEVEAEARQLDSLEGRMPVASHGGHLQDFSQGECRRVRKKLDDGVTAGVVQHKKEGGKSYWALTGPIN